MLEFYFRFRRLRLYHHRHVILHLPTKFRANRTIRDVVMTSSIFQDGGHGIATTSGFGFRDFAHLGRSKYTCIPNHTIRDIVMTSYPFSKMAAVSHIELSQCN